MRRCLRIQVVQTRWYSGPCGHKGRWHKAPGERDGKDTGLKSRMPGAEGQRGYRGGTGSQTPRPPRRIPLRCVWVRLRTGGVSDQPSLLIVSRYQLTHSALIFNM